MKKLVKKNQVIITALSIMIAVAGYLNFSSRDLPLEPQEVSVTAEQPTDPTKEDVDAKAEAATGEAVDTMDVSDADAAALQGAKGNSDDAMVSVPVQDEIAQNNGEGSSAQIGEAVLTSASASDFISKAKFNREQTRAKSKETLLEIINNTNLVESQKNSAIEQMLKLTNNMEMETQTEQFLGAKGFLDSVVSISEGSVDVLISKTKINDVEKAQIEDIVNRKTNIDVEQIVISTLKAEN